MSEKISVGRTITESAGGESDTTIYTVQAAKKLRITRVRVHFPSGQNYQLQVYIKRGLEQVIPKEGYLAGNGGSIPVECDEIFDSSSEVVVHTKNLDTANEQSCHVIIEGVLE